MRRALRIFAISVAVLIFAAVVAVVAAFVYENDTWVVVKAPVWGESFSDPLAWIAYDVHEGGALIGAFLGGVFSVIALLLIPLSLRRAFEYRRRERVIGSLEGELSDLRNLPLIDPAPYEDIDEEVVVGASEKDDSKGGTRRKRAAQLIAEDDDALLIAALQEESAEPSGARSGR